MIINGINKLPWNPIKNKFSNNKNIIKIISKNCWLIKYVLIQANAIGYKKWSINKCIYLNSMLENNSGLEILILNKFRSYNVIIMSKMIKGYNGLLKLEINNFNYEKVREMDEIFSGVISLRELDLISFYTRNLILWNNIWYNITELNIQIYTSKK